MSEAILTFQSQLSDIMETVLKTAVHEITCLVEDSFQGEVVRSRKEVETLRQKLQWSERRWRDRERGAKTVCSACGRAPDFSAEIKRKTPGTKHGYEEGRGIKKEKTTIKNRGSCLWESLATAPSSVPDKEGSPSSISFGEITSATLPNSEGARSDLIHKEEGPLESGSISDVPSHLQLTVNYSSHPAPESEQFSTAECAMETVTENRIKSSVDELDKPEPILDGGPEYSGGSVEGLGSEYKMVTVVSHKDHGLAIGGRNLSCISQEDSELRTGFNFVPQDLHRDTGKSEEIQIEDVVSLSSPHQIMNNIRRKHSKMESSPDEPFQVAGWENTAQANSDVPYDQGSFTATRNIRISQGGGNGDNQNICIYCGKSFAYISRLKIHLLKHTGEKPFSCIQCGKRFTVARNLERHQKIHWGDASFICTQCGKSFRRADHLKVHQRVHTGERPYCCTHCNKCFRFSGDLNTHKRVHTGEKPYCCTICGNRFSQLRQLKSHMRVHRGSLGRFSQLTQ